MTDSLPRNWFATAAPWIVAVGAWCSAAGCRPAAENPTPSAPSLSTAPVDLTLVVLDDPALAEGIARRAGDWQVLTGGRLLVEQSTWTVWLDGSAPAADALIYASRHLGELCERRAIVEVRRNLLETPDYQVRDVFPLVRQREARWGAAPMALPLGAPQLVLYYRADLLQELRRQPPTTWTEYGELVALLRDRTTLARIMPDVPPSWRACAEPLAPAWAGRTLLARAASYAVHRDQYSALFSIDTMEPLIAGPPFVRALEEMVAAAGADSLRTDPAGVRRCFYQGQCALALSWPSAAAPDAPTGIEVSVGIAPPPAARQVFHLAGGDWETRPAGSDSQVALVALAGRLGSVLAASRNSAAAMRLLAWLGGPEIATDVCTASDATTLFRHSQIDLASRWVEPPLPAATARAYAEQIAALDQREAWLCIPRIPAAEAYLDALNRAAIAALDRSAEPTAALREAADRWREITTQRGVDAQKNAYRNSLGLVP